MKTQKQNKPQLSAEMEKRFNEAFPNEESGYLNKQGEYVHLFNPAVDTREIKTFLATAIEEQRAEYVSKVKAYIDAIYPLNRFIDSSTGVVTRGVQEPTHVRMMRVEDAQTFNALEHVLAILTKKEQ